MRTPTLLMISGLSLAMSACAPMIPSSTDLSSSPVSTATVAPVPGYDWFLHLDGSEARLAYGLRDSDDLRLGMDCRRGSGRLELSATGAARARPEIHIESGGETGRYPAESEISELHDGVFLTAHANTTAPVFQRFRSVGWLAHWQDGDRHAYAAQRGSRETIERFFAFCG